MCKGSDGFAASTPAPLPLKKIATMNVEELPTKKQLKDAIPEHCFKHSIPRSLALVARDAIINAAIFYVGWNYVPLLECNWSTPAGIAGKLAWQAYWFLQGTALTGWWVLAHECGHGGFSANSTLNDAVGWVLHSFLLVPYFSWKYSHAKHHAKTNHLLDGETHVPPSRKYVRQFQAMHNVIGEDAFALYELVVHLLLGWPMYLLFNATGARRTPQGERITTVHDHFRPWSKLFPSNRKWDLRVFSSTLGCLLTLCGLYQAGKIYGFSRVSWTYFPSYLWCNFWLVLYTWLQHTAPDLPHFGEDEWTWVRGGLCTIDRPYGVFDWMHHHIGSTHVTHHLFSSLPCYHAVEATAALKAYLEPKGLYHYDPTPWPIAAWRIAHECHYVEDIKGVQHYRSLSSKKNKKA